MGRTPPPINPLLANPPAARLTFIGVDPVRIQCKLEELALKREQAAADEALKPRRRRRRRLSSQIG